MEVGPHARVRPIGSRAFNIARIEAGFLLPNVDFVSAEHTLRVGSERSPLELGLGVAGRLRARATSPAAARCSPSSARGPRRLLVGLDIEGNKPAHNALLYSERSGKHQVGSVTSATWSPTCKRNIALAMVDAPHITTGLDALGRDLPEPRAGVGAPHGAGARRRATVLRARATPGRHRRRTSERVTMHRSPGP